MRFYSRSDLALTRYHQRGGIELAVVLVVLIGVLAASMTLMTALGTGDRIAQARNALAGTTNQRLFLAVLGTTGTKILQNPGFVQPEMLGYAKRLGILATPDGDTYASVCVALFEITNAAADCSGAIANELLPSLGGVPLPQKIDSTGTDVSSTDIEGCATQAVKDAAVRTFSGTCDHSFPYVLGISFTDYPGVVTAKTIDANPFGGVLGSGVGVGISSPGLPGKTSGVATP